MPLSEIERKLWIIRATSIHPGWAPVMENLINLQDDIEKLRQQDKDAREAQGWEEAAEYSDDPEAQDDFMTGWRTADRTRK